MAKSVSRSERESRRSKTTSKSPSRKPSKSPARKASKSPSRAKITPKSTPKTPAKTETRGRPQGKASERSSRDSKSRSRSRSRSVKQTPATKKVVTPTQATPLTVQTPSLRQRITTNPRPTLSPAASSPITRARLNSASAKNGSESFSLLAFLGAALSGLFEKRKNRTRKHRRDTIIVWSVMFLLFIAVYIYNYKYNYYKQAYAYAQGHLDAARAYINRK